MKPVSRSRSSSMACASAVILLPTTASCTVRVYASEVSTASEIRKPPKTRPSTLAMAQSAASRVETDQLARENRRGSPSWGMPARALAWAGMLI